MNFQDEDAQNITKKRWEVIQSALSKNIQSIKELEEAISTYNPECGRFEPLDVLFDRVSIIPSKLFQSKI